MPPPNPSPAPVDPSRDLSLIRVQEEQPLYTAVMLPRDSYDTPSSIEVSLTAENYSQTVTLMSAGGTKVVQYVNDEPFTITQASNIAGTSESTFGNLYSQFKGGWRSFTSWLPGTGRRTVDDGEVITATYIDLTARVQVFKSFTKLRLARNVATLNFAEDFYTRLYDQLKGLPPNPQTARLMAEIKERLTLLSHVMADVANPDLLETLKAALTERYLGLIQGRADPQHTWSWVEGYARSGAYEDAKQDWERIKLDFAKDLTFGAYQFALAMDAGPLVSSLWTAVGDSTPMGEHLSGWGFKPGSNWERVVAAVDVASQGSLIGAGAVWSHQTALSGREMSLGGDSAKGWKGGIDYEGGDVRPRGPHEATGWGEGLPSKTPPPITDAPVGEPPKAAPPIEAPKASVEPAIKPETGEPRGAPPPEPAPMPPEPPPEVKSSGGTGILDQVDKATKPLDADHARPTDGVQTDKSSPLDSASPREPTKTPPERGSSFGDDSPKTTDSGGRSEAPPTTKPTEPAKSGPAEPQPEPVKSPTADPPKAGQDAPIDPVRPAGEPALPAEPVRTGPEPVRPIEPVQPGPEAPRPVEPVRAGPEPIKPLETSQPVSDPPRPVEPIRTASDTGKPVDAVPAQPDAVRRVEPARAGQPEGAKAAEPAPVEQPKPRLADEPKPVFSDQPRSVEDQTLRSQQETQGVPDRLAGSPPEQKLQIAAEHVDANAPTRAVPPDQLRAAADESPTPRGKWEPTAPDPLKPRYEINERIQAHEEILQEVRQTGTDVSDIAQRHHIDLETPIREQVARIEADRRLSPELKLEAKTELVREFQMAANEAVDRALARGNIVQGRTFEEIPTFKEQVNVGGETRERVVFDERGNPVEQGRLRMRSMDPDEKLIIEAVIRGRAAELSPTPELSDAGYHEMVNKLRDSYYNEPQFREKLERGYAVDSEQLHRENPVSNRSLQPVATEEERALIRRMVGDERPGDAALIQRSLDDSPASPTRVELDAATREYLEQRSRSTREYDPALRQVVEEERRAAAGDRAGEPPAGADQGAPRQGGESGPEATRVEEPFAPPTEKVDTHIAEPFSPPTEKVDTHIAEPFSPPTEKVDTHIEDPFAPPAEHITRTADEPVRGEASHADPMADYEQPGGAERQPHPGGEAASDGVQREAAQSDRGLEVGEETYRGRDVPLHPAGRGEMEDLMIKLRGAEFGLQQGTGVIPETMRGDPTAFKRESLFGNRKLIEGARAQWDEYMGAAQRIVNENPGLMDSLPPDVRDFFAQRLEIHEKGAFPPDWWWREQVDWVHEEGATYRPSPLGSIHDEVTQIEPESFHDQVTEIEPPTAVPSPPISPVAASMEMDNLRLRIQGNEAALREATGIDPQSMKVAVDRKPWMHRNFGNEKMIEGARAQWDAEVQRARELVAQHPEILDNASPETKDFFNSRLEQLNRNSLPPDWWWKQQVDWVRSPGGQIERPTVPPIRPSPNDIERHFAALSADVRVEMQHLESFISGPNDVPWVPAGTMDALRRYIEYPEDFVKLPPRFQSMVRESLRIAAQKQPNWELPPPESLGKQQ